MKQNQKTTVPISTVLAWRIVNYSTEGGLKMPKTPWDSEVENEEGHTLDKEGWKILDIFNALFMNDEVRVNYSFTNIHTVLYEFLRPELVAQYPQLLACTDPGKAKQWLGDVLDLSTELKYKFHEFYGPRLRTKIAKGGFKIEIDTATDEIVSITPPEADFGTIRVNDTVIANGKIHAEDGTEGAVVSISEPYADGRTSDVINCKFVGKGSEVFFMKFKELRVDENGEFAQKKESATA